MTQSGIPQLTGLSWPEALRKASAAGFFLLPKVVSEAGKPRLEVLWQLPDTSSRLPESNFPQPPEESFTTFASSGDPTAHSTFQNSSSEEGETLNRQLDSEFAETEAAPNRSEHERTRRQPPPSVTGESLSFKGTGSRPPGKVVSTTGQVPQVGVKSDGESLLSIQKAAQPVPSSAKLSFNDRGEPESTKPVATFSASTSSGTASDPRSMKAATPALSSDAKATPGDFKRVKVDASPADSSEITGETGHRLPSAILSTSGDADLCSTPPTPVAGTKSLEEFRTSEREAQDSVAKVIQVGVAMPCWLRHLPEVFAEADSQRGDFLKRFLELSQHLLLPVETRIADFSNALNPHRASADDLLRLCSWFALKPVHSDAAQLRELLLRLPLLWSLSGTAEGLKLALELFAGVRARIREEAPPLATGRLGCGLRIAVEGAIGPPIPRWQWFTVFISRHSAAELPLFHKIIENHSPAHCYWVVRVADADGEGAEQANPEPSQNIAANTRSDTEQQPSKLSSRQSRKALSRLALRLGHFRFQDIQSGKSNPTGLRGVEPCGE